MHEKCKNQDKSNADLKFRPYFKNSKKFGVSAATNNGRGSKMYQKNTR